MAPTVMAAGAEAGDVPEASACLISNISNPLLKIGVFRAPRCATHVIIPGSDHGDDACVVDSLDGVVDGLREGSSKRHIHDGLSLAVRGCDVVGDPLHALQHARVGAGAAGVEDLNGHDVDVLGDAKGASAESAGDVAPMAVLVRVLRESPLS